MDLLYRREQGSNALGTHVIFRLWGKIELNADEQAIMDRYSFASAVMIEVDQPYLLRQALLFGVLATFASFIVVRLVMGYMAPDTTFFLALLGGAGCAYWWYNERRETIFVHDLLHGRHFRCRSVAELVKKEAWLTEISGYLRQLMDVAKRWDDTERIDIEPLKKHAARQYVAES